MALPCSCEAPAAFHRLKVQDDIVVGEIALGETSDGADFLRLGGRLTAVGDNGDGFARERESSCGQERRQDEGEQGQTGPGCASDHA